jgi:GPH family glycoside/pentoside/hexuronide:cation symporter
MTQGRQVGLGEKLAYSMGGVANFYMANLLPLLALPGFSVGLGIDAWKVGLAMGLPRLWDALIDPYIGHLSDSLKSRWGRRRPFLLVGALVALITYSLLWLPTPAWGKDATFWWFLTWSFLYYTAFSIYSIPFIAIGYEIATDSKELAKLMTIRSFVSSIFSLLMPWVYAMCFWNWTALQGSGSLSGRLAALIVSPDGKTLQPPGYQIVGILLAVFMAVAGCLALFCREKPQVAAPNKHDFRKSMGVAFRNRPFIILSGSLVFAMVGIFLIMPLSTYVNIYHIYAGDQAKAAAMLAKVGSIQAIVGIAFVPVAGYIISRFGAARMMKLFLLCTAVSFASKYWTYTPANPWLQLAPLTLWSIGWAGTMLTFNVMLGDVCDYDEYTSGVRREGMYGAINQFLTKMGIFISTSLSGFVLSLSGIVAGAAEQTPRAVWLMRVEFSIVPFLIALAASCAFFFYPLTDKRANEIRDAIKARKT